MSDDQGPALSRRALRELRRAEAEAQLAQNPAAAVAQGNGNEAETVPEPSAIAPARKQPKPAAKKPAAPAQPEAKKAAPAQPEAKKAAPAQPEAKKAAPVNPVAKAPGTEAPDVGKPVPVALKAVAPVSKPPAPQGPAATQDPTPEAPAAAARNRRSAPGPVDTPAAPRTERSSLQRARDRENLRERRRLEGAAVSTETTNIPSVSPGDDPSPLTRRQLRLQALNAAKSAAPGVAMDSVDKNVAIVPEAAAADESGRSAGSPDTGEQAAIAAAMSVEAALAARRRLVGKQEVAPVLLQPLEDFSTIDLEVLAQQRELAARAAIISRRAAERQRLENENSARLEQKRSDPFTGALHHLRDPEAEKQLANTGVSGPETRGIRLDLTGQVPSVKTPAEATESATAAPAAGKPSDRKAKPGVQAPVKPQLVEPASATPQAVAKPKPEPVAKQAVKPTAGFEPGQSKPKSGRPIAPVKRARTRSGAEAVESAEDIVPVRADDAQGLDPLDALTAGMRRANNMYLMVIAALAIGGAALITGIIMITTSR
ncbi:hypothetical protein [Paeniglutamicibacter cryotolerans]|uniref:Uncharacterized protein n=1 Tax=Paeniglutamicibacter cryotolerans TaxID=670079 RepID=A0A839QQC3_9MICC|nr:hypothetical protein [Paeniglutamicibacter cryotolerans]MBB2996964.1 hypothetical protein [Paeniglutamicibacter cryotolerans]